MQFDVHNMQVKKVGTVDLPDEVFAAEIKEAVMWEQVKAQRASRRRGTHKTKNRGEVSGGGAKPFKQKGSGRARQGSSRSPIMVGGGVVFGPRPRDYSYRLPRSARRAALRSALSLRVKEGNLMVVEGANMDAPRTKDMVAFLNAVGSNSILILDQQNENLQKSVRNLPKSKFLQAAGINVYDILNYEKLVVTQAALNAVIEKALGTQDEAKEAA